MLLRATHLCHSEEQSDVRISRKGILISRCFGTSKRRRKAVGFSRPRFFGTAKDDAKMRRLTKTVAALHTYYR